MDATEPRLISFSREEAHEAREDLQKFRAAYEAWLQAPEDDPEERSLRSAVSRAVPGAERGLLYGGEGSPEWGYPGGPRLVGLANIVFQAEPDQVIDLLERADAGLERQETLFEKQERAAREAEKDVPLVGLPAGAAQLAVSAVKSPGAQKVASTLSDIKSVLEAVDALASPKHVVVVKRQGGDGMRNNTLRAVTMLSAGLERWTPSGSTYRDQAKRLLDERPSHDPDVVPLLKSVVFALADDLRAGRTQPPGYSPGIEHAANRVGSVVAAVLIAGVLAVICVGVLASLSVSPVLGLPAAVLWGPAAFVAGLTVFGFVQQLAAPRRWLAARIAGRLIGPLSR